MNIIHLVLLQFVVLGVLSVPMARLFDPQGIGYLAQFTDKAGAEAVIRAYHWTVYAAIVLALLFYMTGIRRRIVAYQQKPEIYFTYRTYIRVWTISVFAGFICGLFLFIQMGLQHPGLAAMDLNYQDYAILRIATSNVINRNLYNLGLYMFVSLAMIVAVFYLKSLRRVTITLALFVTLGSFSLAKAPMVGAILGWLFFYLTVKRPSLISISFIGIIILVMLVLMFFISKFAESGHSMIAQISDRVFYGQFADLPYYLERFEADKVSFVALLPPYIQHWFDPETIPSAAQMVMEYTNPDAVAKGSVGVANTLFIGEAYAWRGIWGVVLAPFWVGLHFWVVTVVFTQLNKNIWSAFMLAYLYHRMSDALIGGFSYFVFSSIHIILFASIGVIVIQSLRRSPPRSVGRKVVKLSPGIAP